MKKVLYIAMLLIAVMATGCGSKSYDQKTVDELQKKIENATEQPKEDDVIALVEQAGFALDEAEKADDIAKWSEENEKKAETIMGASVLCEMVTTDDFSDDSKKAIEEFNKRAEKFMEKTMEAAMEAGGMDSNDYDMSDSYDEEVSAEVVSTPEVEY